MTTCTATWSSGSCDREARAAELCPGHYQQKRRGGPFKQLKNPHGADPRGLVPVTSYVPAADVQTLKCEATRRGVDLSEIYREAVAAFAAQLRGNDD